VVPIWIQSEFSLGGLVSWEVLLVLLVWLVGGPNWFFYLFNYFFIYLLTQFPWEWAPPPRTPPPPQWRERGGVAVGVGVVSHLAK
jgi:hypothetical protein